MEIIFKVIPVKYISTIAATTESGMEHAITIVGLISFRNSSNTKIARIAPDHILHYRVYNHVNVYALIHQYIQVELGIFFF